MDSNVRMYKFIPHKLNLAPKFKLEKTQIIYIYLTVRVLGVGIVSAMEIINEFSGEGIEKLQNLK